MKIVTWLSVLTEHQVHTFRHLGELHDEPSEYVLCFRSIEERKGQGWTEIDLAGPYIHELPKKGWWSFGKKIITQFPEAVHIFNGMWGDRRLLAMLLYAQWHGVRTCLITEPYADITISYFSKKSGLLDRIKFAIRPLVYKVAGALLARRMTAVFAISAKAAKQFQAIGFSQDKVFPFGYFVPAMADHSNYAWAKGTTGRLRLVFVGNLIERKGLSTLVEAVKLCNLSSCQVSLDVYGPGDSGGIHAPESCIFFHGSIAFGKVQLVIRQYDVLVVPSIHDGWAVVVNEALLQSVPVICSDAVGAKVLVQKSGAGSIFPASDSMALASLLTELLRNPDRLVDWRSKAAGLGDWLSPAVAARYQMDCLKFSLGQSRIPAFSTMVYMKQLHVVMDLSIRSGGQARAALHYAQANASAGAEVTLYVVNPTDDTLEDIRVSGCFRVVYARRLKMIHMFSCLARGTFDMVHLHGTWSPMLVFVSLIARAFRLPYLVSPHGCLEPWALNHRRTKKLIALALYQRHVLCKAAMLVATAEQELRSIHRQSINTPVAVIPLGVDLPDVSIPSIKLAKRILFMSRIHPVKGLIELVSAWALVRQSGWTVVIAGPDEGGHEAAVKAQIRLLGLEGDFLFTGLVEGEAKEQLFAECDFFILPSHSENFGMVVAEALARSLPVITTTGTPWELLQTRGCGWWVSPDVDGLALALSQALNMSKSELNQMGIRGRELVSQEFAWEKIGMMAFEATDWVLNKSAPVPKFINVGESL